MDEFPCTKCGLCCKHIGETLANIDKLHPKLQDLLINFPYEAKPDGSCSMLTDEGLCSVYDHKPIVCSIKYTAILLGHDITDYYRISAEYCNHLITQAGLSDDYLVKLEESTKETPQTYEEGRKRPRKRRRRKNTAKGFKSP